MKILIVFLICVSACFGQTNVACNNNSGDNALIVSGISAAGSGGIVQLSGTCSVGAGNIAVNFPLIIRGTANVTMNAAATAFVVNSDNVNFNNIAFSGGMPVYLTSPTGTGRNSNGQRTGFQFIANSCTNSNGVSCLQLDPVLINAIISFSAFNNGFAASDNPNSTCNGWSGGCNSTGAPAINNSQGQSGLTIENNTFDLWPNDAIHMTANIIAQSRFWFQETNNSISYNTFTRIHRMPIETQGDSAYTQCNSGASGNPATNAPGTPANCTNNNIIFAINSKKNGNYSSNPLQPFYNMYGASFVDGWGGDVLNNTFLLNNWSGLLYQSGAGYGMEQAMYTTRVQGNVIVSDTSDGTHTLGWGSIYAQGAAPNAQPTTWTYNNNVAGGPNAVANQYTNDCSGFTCPTSTTTVIKNSNYVNNVAPNAGSLTTPAINFTLVSSPTASGVQTFNYAAISTLSVKWVKWNIDGSPVVLQTQEASDVSSTFATDRQWLYHVPITLSSYAGTHALTATATDVSGFTRSVTTNFTGTAAGAGITFTPSAGLAFGNSNVGVAPAGQTMTIQNSGSMSITTLALSVVGTNASDFGLSSNTCPATLTAGASCSVVVTFTPSAAGGRMANLNVANSLVGSPQLLPLSGTGTNPSVGILTNGDFATGSLSPQTYSSTSSTAVVDTVGGCGGGNNVDINFTAANSGNSQLIFPNLTLPPNGTQMQLSFYASSAPGRQINALVTQNVSPFTNYGLGSGFVGYQPTLTGTCIQYVTTFTVANSPTAGSAQLAIQLNNSLSGDNYHFAKFVLQQVTGSTTAALTSSTLNFGPDFLSVAKTATVILQNTGTNPLTISSISIPASDFTQTNSCGSTLAAGVSCPILVTFTPSALGNRTATLTVTDSATNSPQTAALSGMGSHLVFAAAPDYVSHSSVRLQLQTDLLVNVLRSRSAISPATCTGGTGGLVQPMEISAGLAAQVQAGATLIMDVTGLDPGASTTTGNSYNICPELSTDGGTTWTSGVGTTVTLQPKPAVHPALPLAPKQFNPTYPDDSGYVQYTVASDCSDLGTAYRAAIARQATQGTHIKIHGTSCAAAGNLSFSLQPVDVNVWHPANVNVSNSSITLGGSPTLTVGQGVRFGFSYKAFESYPASNSCPMNNGLVSGQVYYVSQVLNSANNTVTLACNQNNAPGAPMVFTSQGTDTLGNGFFWVPEVRTLNWILVTSDAPANNLPPFGVSMTPAYQPNLAVLQSQLANLNAVNPAGSLIQFTNCCGDAGNIENMVDHIWLSGFEITTVDSPGAHTSFDPKPWRGLVYMVPVDSNIVMERNYVHMLGTPNRAGPVNVTLDGYNVFYSNNYNTNALYYHSQVVGAASTISSAHVISEASGSINYGSGTIAVPAHTITLAGTASGRVLRGVDPLNSNAYTVWTTTGLTASCSPSCVNTNIGAVAGSSNCDTNDQWPLNSQGDPAAGPTGCATVTGGTITAVQTADVQDSKYWTEGAQWMTCGHGPGPTNVTGNYWEGAGILSHCDDAGVATYNRGDMTFVRNYFKAPFKYMYDGGLGTNPLSDGLGYDMRQPHEFKSGNRVKVDGEIIDGFWSEQENSSNGILLTSVNGQGLSNINIQNSTLMHGPGGLASLCDSTPGGSYNLPPPCVGYRFVNNLSWDVNPRYSAPYRYGYVGFGWASEGMNAAEDVIYKNNTFVGNFGADPAVIWLFDSNTEGVDVENNIFYIDSATQGLRQDGSVPNGPCSGLIGKAMADCKFTPSYVWKNNLMVGNGQTPGAVAAAWPSPLTNYFQTGSSSLPAVGWYNYLVPTFGNGNPQDQDYDLMDSAQCKAGSSASNDHSQDCGANMVTLRAAQGHLRLTGIPANTITTTGLTVQYSAPDSAPIYVDVCAASDTLCITPLQRIQDAGGSIFRSTAVTGLTTKTFYNLAVRGQGNPIEGQRFISAWTN